jgi:ATP-dependent DNA helicase RecQ
MVAFAETQQCRMTAIIRHFGDTADAHRPCGICDVCSPATATAQTYRPPTPEDLRQLMYILQELDDRSRSTGKLFSALSEGALRGTPAGKDRKTFDTLLDALDRAGLIALSAESFTNAEGNLIPYKKVSLTHEGREAVSTGNIHAPDILLPDTNELDAPATKSKKSKSSKVTRKTEREQTTAAFTPAQQQLDGKLRAWRKSEAAKTGKPAFIVFGDAVLRNLVLANPQTIPDLLTVSGIGPEKADRFGAEIIAICRAETTTVSTSASLPEIKPSSRPERSGVEGPPHFSRSANALGEKTAIFHRPRPTTPDPAASLTPAQQLLDAELRAWRKSEAERIGLPQFFVLGSSALRSIVLLRPKSLVQLQSISGIGPEKADKFGAAILALCNA